MVGPAAGGVRLRIGIDANCWINRRGFGRFTRELVGALVRQDRADYVLLADQEAARQIDVPATCTVVAAGTAEAAAVSAASSGRRSLAHLWAMRRAAARIRLDAMFFPAVYSYFPMPGGSPCVVTFHDVIAETLPHLVFTDRRTRLFWNLKCRAAAWRADHVLTVSEDARKGIAAQFKVPPERISVVPEAPGAAFAAGPGVADPAVLARHGVTESERYLLYVGGISPHKNLAALFRAFQTVRQGHAELADVRLILVGDYQNDVFSTCHADLLTLAKGLQVSAHIRFAGYVPDGDLVHLYRGATALVLPSYLEGFGLPAVEAMACGCAVLASNRGSLPEILGAAGMLFDPDDTAALVGEMAQVLLDDRHRKALQQRGLIRALDFSWGRAAKETFAVLARVAGPNRVRAAT